MQELKTTCESTVALAQLKFFCQVTDMITQYTNFFTSLLRNKTNSNKAPQSLKSEDAAIKSFSEKKSKELMEFFKSLQKEVLEKVKDLESRNNSISFDFSDISESPKTPPFKAPRISFGTPQGHIKDKSDLSNSSKLKTQYCSFEKRSRIKKTCTSDLSIARCLFKTR